MSSTLWMSRKTHLKSETSQAKLASIFTPFSASRLGLAQILLDEQKKCCIIRYRGKGPCKRKCLPLRLSQKVGKSGERAYGRRRLG
jgi:hypothetical protein